MADNLLGRIAALDLEGNPVDLEPGPSGLPAGLGTLMGFQPQAAHGTAERLFVQERETDAIHTFGLDLSPGVSLEPRRVSLPKLGRLASVHRWIPTDRGIFGLADFKETVKDPTGAETARWHSAFVSLGFNGSNRSWSRLPADPAARNRVKHSYIYHPDFLASLGGSVFMLSLESAPRLLRLDLDSGSSTQLGPLPRDLASFPQLVPDDRLAKEMRGPYQAYLFHRQIESQSLVAGLHAWNGALFLLGKSGLDDQTASVTWTLARLDPSTGKEVGRVTLPTRAANLTVVPGEHWAFIEKGRAEARGEHLAAYLPINSVRFIASEVIESATR